ncbi:hypothetical protein [Hymenobacter weizhouensis]|uniref:hypothetical protein n=1 Tax=Hymenobacter sp. YIM 151500-1 TaxID=2987689 RepID=UPI0022277514|nr:hypothetical protein [Hymenobacter sp. YIM 151500-1]UYZ62941.1 hypothetical protein OIS53_18350 [Hymenobacter sp. YIM 151500-1]
MRHSILLLAAALLLALPSVAQRRLTYPTLLQPQAQIEIPLTGDSYLFGAFNLQHLNLPVVENPAFPIQNIRLGYERFSTSAWSWGATVNGQRDEYRKWAGSSAEVLYTVTPEVFGRHWNTFGSVNFRQRLGVQYLAFLNEADRANRLASSLRLDVDRVFPLGSGRLALRPRVAAEAVTYLRFQRDEDEEKEPFLDFSELRGEVGVRISPRFDFTPWFAWRNQYYTELPQYDVDGNLTIAGGTVRNVQLTVGLDLRLTLGSAPDAERRQLPTQY